MLSSSLGPLTPQQATPQWTRRSPVDLLFNKVLFHATAPTWGPPVQYSIDDDQVEGDVASLAEIKRDDHQKPAELFTLSVCTATGAKARVHKYLAAIYFPENITLSIYQSLVPATRPLSTALCSQRVQTNPSCPSSLLPWPPLVIGK